MSITSANLNDLQTFLSGSSLRTNRLVESLTSIIRTTGTVQAACGGSEFPDTGSLTALNDLLTTWVQNHQFVQVVHDDLLAADRYDSAGNAYVNDTIIRNDLVANGLDRAPDLITVPAVTLYGEPPYSGFRDDPICMANGNFLFRDGDLEMFGIASSLSVIRTYNSRDASDGAFGPSWTSLLDVVLAVEERRASFRGVDGGGAVFQQRDDGTWVGGERRRLALEPADDGWVVRERHLRAWRFDAAGTLVGFEALAADVVVDRNASAVRFTDQTSGRWIEFAIEGGSGRATAASTSDGRIATYDRDDQGRVVAVHRPDGDATYTYDDGGFLASIVDADGITTCRNIYDADGRVLAQVEQHGRETAYEYRADGVAVITATDGAPPNVMVHDRRGRMTAIIDGLGNTMRLAYDDDDNLVQLVDRTGATTQYVHDDRGNLVRRTDPDGLLVEAEWDAADRLVSETDRAGRTTRFWYEGDGRDPVRIVQPDGAQSHLTYDPDTGLPLVVTDADGVTTTFTWTRDGLLDTLADALGGSLTFEYDAAGRSRTLTTSADVRAEVEIDEGGRLLALRTAAGERTFAYTAAGRLVGGADEFGNTWTGTLDATAELSELSDVMGPLLRLEHDATGRVIATADADGNRTTFDYDPTGRLTAMTDPLGRRASVEFDAEGRSTEVTDRSGRTRHRQRDLLGRPIASTDAAGRTRSYTYHPNGELASVTDAAGATWRYEIDVSGRVVAAIDPLGNATTYEYTQAGRLAEIRSPLGRAVRRTYDSAGSLAEVAGPDGTLTRFERRTDGLVTQVTHGGATTTFGYDDAGRETEVAGPWGGYTTTYGPGPVQIAGRVGTTPARFEQDQRSLLARVTDPAGVVTSFARDRCGRVTRATTGELITTYGWDPTGALASLTDPHGQQTTFERDPRGAIQRVRLPDGRSITCAYGDDGQISIATDGDGTEILRVERDVNARISRLHGPSSHLDLAWDPLGQVTSVANDGGTVHYEWDADGAVARFGDDTGFEVQIERGPAGETAAFLLAGDQRVQVPEPVALQREGGKIVVDELDRRFEYDLAGRLASATTDAGTARYDYDDLGLLSAEHTLDGVRTYRYGRAAELLSYRREDGTETTFTYDAAGRRIGETGSDGSRATYRWDAVGRLSQVVRVAADGSETVQDIEHDPLGRPMRLDGVSIRWDTGVTGNVIGIGDERFLWWGDQVRSVDAPEAAWSRLVPDDPWGDDGGSGVRLGFRGELAIDGLVFLGARVYDTRTRQFLTRDPLDPVPGMVSYAGAYSYAWCDPVNFVDPSGERPISDADYDKMRKDASSGLFDRIAANPLKYLEHAAVLVGSIAAMAVASAVLGPVGLVIAGALVGALSAGLDAKIDGKSWGDVGRAALIGGIVGGLGAGAGGMVNKFLGGTSTAETILGRLAGNVGRQALSEYPQAFAEEALDSYMPGDPSVRDGRFDLDKALFSGTTGTASATAGHYAGNKFAEHELNKANTAELEKASQIGPTLAKRVVEQRPEGGYRSPADLMKIHEIGPKRTQSIYDLMGDRRMPTIGKEVVEHSVDAVGDSAQDLVLAD
jgi:RHS repeat-associated protein